MYLIAYRRTRSTKETPSGQSRAWGWPIEGMGLEVKGEGLKLELEQVWASASPPHGPSEELQSVLLYVVLVPLSAWRLARYLTDTAHILHIALSQSPAIGDVPPYAI
jgi:hypothetical protein